MRRIGIRAMKASMSASPASPVCIAATPGVATPPGAIAFTQIRCGANSSALDFVNPHAPCFDAS